MMQCQYCYQELEANTEACSNCGRLVNPPAVEYFYTPPWRFILLSLLTLGLYKTYWFYKDWAAIKKAERTRIHPLLRALFYMFFIYSLFERMDRAAKVHGYKRILSASWLYLLFIVGFFSTLLARFLPFLLLFCVLLIYVPLLLIQGTIRFHNSHAISGYQGRKKWTKGEVIFVILINTWLIGTTVIYHGIWRPFHAPNHTFSVMLPLSVKHTLGEKLPIEDSDLTIQYDFYKSESFLIDYAIEVFTYPSEVTPVSTEEMMKDFLALAFSDKGEEVLSSEATLWGEYPALDFTAKQKTRYVKGRVIAAGQTLYVLTATYTFSSYSEKGYHKLIHSFAILK